GTLSFRKSCRMMICGSCGMRMDGAAVLACKTRMYDIAQAGHVPTISAMGNLPIVKDLVVDMEPFWEKFKAMNPYLQPGYERPEDEREYLISQERMNAVHKESLCINCGCCVSECNAMESDPDFLGLQALAKGMRFVGDPRDAATVERLEDYGGEHGLWECARCCVCNERCLTGVDPRDAAGVGEGRALHKLVHEQWRLGYAGHVQGEPALAKLEHGYTEGRDPYGPGSFPRPYLPGEENGSTKQEGGA